MTELRQPGNVGLTSAAYGRTIWDCINPSFSANPTKIAVRTTQGAHTYRELENAVLRLEGALIDRGVGRGSRVGICLDRSPELLVSILATTRLGAAYVSLDPAFPIDRLSYMASDAALSVVITNPDHRHRCPGIACDVIDVAPIHDPSSLPEASALSKSMPAAGPRDLAYVMYTSGTTGRPKGVMISQGAVANFLDSMLERPGLDDHDRLVAVTTASFDISVLELLLPLAARATVVIARPVEAKNGNALRKLLESTEATVMQATASTWRILIDAGWPGSDRFKALVGGEALNTTLAEQLLERCGELWNMYGPTETTVWSTCWKVHRPFSGHISLGDPIANTRIEILDDDFNECPPDTPGEIFISGLGLAEGYWNRPAETTNRFVSIYRGPEQFWRKFRTGDLAQRRADGSLEYLGRKDSQIKLRGYRIEPAEIESRLALHPAISTAAVTLNEFAADDMRLVAFLVPLGKSPETQELREFLGEWLPGYMIPQHYVTLEALPLLPNGKVDRRALTALRLPETPRASARRPSNELEHRITDIWTRILAIDSIGVDDDFMDLGGQSLFAAQIASRITAETGKSCTLAQIYQFPTVAELASALVSPNEDAASCIAVSLRSQGAKPPVFCIAGIDLYQELADRLDPDRPVFGLYADPEACSAQEDAASAPSPVSSLAIIYTAKIREIQPSGPYHLLGFSFGGVIAHAIAVLLQASGETVHFLCLLDSDAPGEIRDARTLSASRLFRQLRERWRHRDPGAEVIVKKWIHNHVPGYFSGSLLFIEASQPAEESSIGWERLADEIELHRLPCNHLDLLKPPWSDSVIAILRQQLADTQRPGEWSVAPR